MAASTLPNSDCDVCLEKLGTSNIVRCGCGYELHRACVHEYLLSVEGERDAHCMHCNRTWDLEFQYLYLGKPFVNGAYRKHRAKFLLDREKTQLPATQQIIEKQKEIKKMEERIKRKRIEEEAAYDNYLKIMQETRILEYTKNSLSSSSRTTTTFVGMPCPREDCNGFLSSGYKCPLCDTKVCSSCFEIKEKVKGKDNEHKCNEENVKSAEEIKKTTKRCPKCHVPVYKIEGCDQMWCVSCHVAFSWNTGKVLTGKIHNPHFFEWARENGTRVRNPGEVVCGGLPNETDILHLLNEHDEETSTDILMIYRGAAEMQDGVIDRLRYKVQQEDENEDIRLKYLKKEITEEKLTSISVRRHTARQKALAMLHVFELYSTVVIEQLNDAVDKMMVGDSIDMITRARTFSNNQFRNIAYNFGTKAYYISSNFHIGESMISHSEFVLT